MDGGEIRYEMSTQWSSSVTWGIDRWSYLGTVDIAPDDATHIADLEIGDYSSISDGLCGKAIPDTGAPDKIRLNTAKYLNYNTDKRRACSLHELGHTIGLDHSYVSQAMDECPVCTNPTYYITPQGHDQIDYHALWG